MPIRIQRYIEPQSLRSEEKSPAIIESDAYRQVCTDLEMYVNGEILGRSFLIAGHRGAGKTTMLRQAVHEVDSRIRQKGATATFARPLFIALHGPDLLAKPSDAPGGEGDKPVDNGEVAKPADPKPQPTDPTIPPQPPPRDELRHFLDRITSGLYVGAAQEFVRCFRTEAIGAARNEREKSELLELAADLQVQLDRQPDLDRLRDYWNRINALDGGVLYKAAKETGRGAAEVTALFSIGRVMRTFAGTLQSSLESEEGRKRDASVSLVTIEGQSLLPPLIGIATGAVVWGALPEATPLVKAFSALLTGFGSVLAFKVSATRSRSSSQTWKETYIPKDDPGSLYRVLPGLIQRFQRVGLFPIFVVDELDKVPGLGLKINSLLGYMKQFVTERAFFCFVTNRSFYQQANAQAMGSAYSTLHTRFGDSVFVLYRPEDFHKYLEKMFSIEGETDIDKAQGAMAMLRYVLLSRSYLHPYDLRRELARWQGGTDQVNRSVDELISSGRLQRDVVVQVAVEVVYAGAALSEHLRDAITAQTVLDALYYPARKWRDGATEVDLTQEALTKYLVMRTGIQEEATEGETAAAADVLIPPALQKTLFEQVERMMTLLCNPPALVEEAAAAGVKLPEAIVKMLRTLEPLVERV